MSWWEWLLLGVGIWVMVVWLLILFNYCFWTLVDPDRDWR